MDFPICKLFLNKPDFKKGRWWSSPFLRHPGCYPRLVQRLTLFVTNSSLLSVLFNTRLMLIDMLIVMVANTPVHLLHERPYVTCSLCSSSLAIVIIPVAQVRKLKQRQEITCPMSHRWYKLELGIETNPVYYKAYTCEICDFASHFHDDSIFWKTWCFSHHACRPATEKDVSAHLSLPHNSGVKQARTADADPLKVP